MPRTRAADAPPVVYRSARIAIRTTTLQRKSCYALLRSGGDVWTWLLDLDAAQRELGEAPIANYQALCRELTRHGSASFGELSIAGARSILRRYADAWMTTAKKRRDGEVLAHYPRRKRSLVPSCYYARTFAIDGHHLRLQVARRASPLVVRHPLRDASA